MSYYESMTLSNGLKVVYVPHKVGSVTCCLRGLAGSNYETANETGAAHILEHLCTFGSENYDSAEALRELVTKRGGRITGTTSRDDVAFLTKTLKESYQDGLNYLFEIFSRPVLTTKNLEKTKNIIKHEIYQNMENPVKHVGRVSYKILYPNQRFSNFNTGGVEDLKNIKLKNVEDFKNKFYAPSNFVLSVCGDLNLKDFFLTTENIFKHIPDFKVNAKLTHRPNYKRGFYIENRSNLNQLHLKIDYHGYKTSQRQKYAAYLLAKLFLNDLKINLRDYINPYILDVSSFNSNSYGLFGLYTAIEPNKLVNFFEIYKDTINLLCNKNVNRSKLEIIKNKTKADFEFNLEKTSLRADFYSELHLYDNLTQDHAEEIQNYLSCTPSEIKKTASQIFGQEPKITVLDKNLTKENLSKTYARVFD